MTISEPQRPAGRQNLAELILRRRPDADARERARAGVLDFLSVVLPVVQNQVTDGALLPLRRVYPGHDPQTLALLLGYCGHALDFDDFHPDFRGHPSTVILPALLAFAGQRDAVAPERFLDAYVTGVEMAGRLGLAAGARHYLQGFHSTGTLGGLAAAAALARLIHADAPQTLNMLGIAASQAAGLRFQFGSAVKPLHAGLAARAAVSAAQLTLAGFAGKHDAALDGFLQTYGGAQSRPEALCENWGAPWRIVAPGIEFKPWPTCSGTHSAADAALALRKQWRQATGLPFSALTEDIARIEVAFPPGGDIAAFVRRPQTGIDARFSLEYVIAQALLEGDLPLTRFDENPVDRTVAALAARVVRVEDRLAPADALNPAARFHQVTLWRRSGERLQSRVTRRQTLAAGVDPAEKLQRTLPNATAAQRQRWIALSRLETPSALSELLGVFSDWLKTAPTTVSASCRER
ncbi:MmgE/PrpD family protein [Brenneria populi]|uniref:MmgE/PrpD family protein n=1 Tax=Brenneria populi TaxID=1505588 RepID=A0ABU6JVM0_9GAMM|nr:MmgE/PrpD family protein [Brenneria populi Li et al. 2015]